MQNSSAKLVSTKAVLGLIILLVTLVGCDSNNEDSGNSDDDISNSSTYSNDADSSSNRSITTQSTDTTSHPIEYSEDRAACSDYVAVRKPLFGDLHVHTGLSFDAVAGRINTMPEDAYDFARGMPIASFPQNENGDAIGTAQLERALDFMSVTDHAEFLGERALCINTESSEYDGEFCTKYREIEFRGSKMLASTIGAVFPDIPQRVGMLCGADNSRCLEAAVKPWQRTLDAAEAAYDRSEECTFTSFVGYEYSGSPGQSNYHRNVIFRNDNAPDLPISFYEAPLDHMLWDQLDGQCDTAENCDYLTIPHNTNMSNGKLLTPYAGMEATNENKVRYAQSRLKREPLMEVFQHKGASECVNGLTSVLGAVDELCEVEQVRVLGQTTTARHFELKGADLHMDDPVTEVTKECKDGEFGHFGMFGGGCISRNDFVRIALITGLEEQQDIGLNPVKLGIIASTDGHYGTPGNVAEDKWSGSVSGEMTVEQRLKPGMLPSGIRGNPGGLAGVWAEENSRDAIFNAMLRRETFGTSGPRILPRFFGGWELDSNSCSRKDMIEHGYEKGIPMGGDLVAHSDSDMKPSFLLAANRDSGGQETPLQQLQIIKGWVDTEGKRRFEVHTVAGSSDNGAGVNVTNGERFGSGHDSLCAVFTDDDFDPDVPSYYYLRAVENPSPRWSLLDCLKLETDARPAACEEPKRQVIQEMAWTSPIWYTPK